MKKETYSLIHSKSVKLYDSTEVHLYELGKITEGGLNFFTAGPTMTLVSCRQEVDGYYLSDEGLKAICGVPDYFLTKDDLLRIFKFIRPDNIENKLLISDTVRARIGNILRQVEVEDMTITELDPKLLTVLDDGSGAYIKYYYKGRGKDEFYVKS